MPEGSMQRLVLSFACVLGLVACAPQVPDSARGVGFESYSDYMKRREAGMPPAAAGQGLPISPERSAPAPMAASQPVGQPLSAVSPALDPNRPRSDAISTVAPQSGELAHNRPSGISDEQDFDAVAARESIESDRERLEQKRAQYVVVQPTALPDRTVETGPNIVEFALATRHNPGTAMYQRSSLFPRNYERACAPFTSADLAQEAFLAQGGPERDKLGVDPDGDGFACGWDPRPFRAAMQ
jgi:hypothetical protein